MTATVVTPAEELLGELRGATTPIMRKFVRQAAAEMKRLIRQPPKTGRIYALPRRRGGSGVRLYQASAPGEAPANRTGALLRSIRAMPVVQGTAVATVEITAPYAELLEFGTPGGRMKARPFINRAIDTVIRNLAL